MASKARRDRVDWRRVWISVNLKASSTGRPKTSPALKPGSNKEQI